MSGRPEGAVAETDPDRRRRPSLSDIRSFIVRSRSTRTMPTGRRSDTVRTTRGDMRPNRQCRPRIAAARGRRRPRHRQLCRKLAGTNLRWPLAPPAPGTISELTVVSGDHLRLAMMWSARTAERRCRWQELGRVATPLVAGTTAGPRRFLRLQLLCLSLHPAHGQLRHRKEPR